MNKLRLIFLLILAPVFLFAHNPLSAKYYLEHGQKGTFINIYLSQDGVNQAMIQQYGEEMLQQQSPLAFKQLIVDYIKDNFELAVNGQVVALREGGIKLGNHQTDLKFLLEPFDSNVQELSIHIPAFQENAQHQTIFSYNINHHIDKVILSKENNYQAVVIIGPPNALHTTWWMIGAGIVTLLLILLFILKKRTTKPSVV
ncbi:MAG: DUF6702 family protein [Aureispira sp.]